MARQGAGLTDSSRLARVASARDEENERWLRGLDDCGLHREDTLERLHDLLLRAALAEVKRRSNRYPLVGAELEDLAHHAAHDAMLTIVDKLGEFRGESRFTTWAYKFVILEVSSKLGRHFWRHPTVALDAAQWDQLPDRLSESPEDLATATELIATIRRIVDEQLTEHQRLVFVALAVDGVPLDALAFRLGTNRNALYKTMFDARRKLRAALVAMGHIDASRGRNHEERHGERR